MNAGETTVAYNTPERMALIERIEKSFAEVIYPGDANIVGNPNDLEAANMLRMLKGKHWSALPLETLLEGSNSLRLLTPAAVHFYLPAFMHIAVSRPDDVDVIPENIVSFLTPPQRGREAAEMFASCIKVFSQAELRTISAFMRFWFNSINPKYLIESDKRAMDFWKEPMNG